MLYQFAKKQNVTSKKPIREILKSGVKGVIIGRRGIEGVPQYLVKFQGKAGPLHCEEGELC